MKEVLALKLNRYLLAEEHTNLARQTTSHQHFKSILDTEQRSQELHGYILYEAIPKLVSRNAGECITFACNHEAYVPTRLTLKDLLFTAVWSHKHTPDHSSLSLLPFLGFPVILALHMHYIRLLCRYVVLDNQC